jgi:cytochrome c peroxidase
MKIAGIAFIVFAALLPTFVLEPEPASPAELGEKLFFEKAFSKDYSISCASCHQPDHGFADTLNFSIGVGGKKGRRNSPSVMNMASRNAFFYDGRASTLEEQVHFPVQDALEMDFDLKKVASRLNKDKKYQAWFKKIFNEKANEKNIAAAIADYERTLETTITRFDNYMNDTFPSMSDAEIRGRTLFMSKKAKCFDCHFTPDFTADEFKNIGLYDERQFTDKGRYEVTKKAADLGRFKVPGLRNVALTPPYMHNGMFNTLEEVVEYYNNPYKFVPKPINMDTILINPLNLSLEEKSDLVAFMKALTDISMEHKIK